MAGAPRNALFPQSSKVNIHQIYPPRTLAAQMFPKLFSSLVLIDPVIVKPPSTEQEYAEGTQERTDNLILGALMRRDTWSSRSVLPPLSPSLINSPLFFPFLLPSPSTQQSRSPINIPKKSLLPSLGSHLLRPLRHLRDLPHPRRQRQLRGKAKNVGHTGSHRLFGDAHRV